MEGVNTTEYRTKFSQWCDNNVIYVINNKDKKLSE